MEITFISGMILQEFAVALGVGASTIAVAQFLAALRSGGPAAPERRLLGVAYIVLRVAMAAILLSFVAQAVVLYLVAGDFSFASPFMLAEWTLIGALFLNAIGMTLRLVKPALGPGIQAGSWYALGALTALIPVGLTNFTYLQFILAYAGLVLLAIALINWFARRAPKPPAA